MQNEFDLGIVLAIISKLSPRDDKHLGNLVMRYAGIEKFRADQSSGAKYNRFHRGVVVLIA